MLSLLLIFFIKKIELMILTRTDKIKVLDMPYTYSYIRSEYKDKGEGGPNKHEDQELNGCFRSLI